MITDRQSDALWGAFEHGSPYRSEPGGGYQGTRSNAGGALHRMIDTLRSQGYLSSRNRLGYEHANEITAKGLSALAEFCEAKARGRKTSAFDRADFEARAVRIRKALPAAEAKEAAASEAASAAATERKAQQAERAAAWRLRKTTEFRAYFEGLNPDHTGLAIAVAAIRRLDDETLIAFVDGIVDREASI